MRRIEDVIMITLTSEMSLKRWVKCNATERNREVKMQMWSIGN